MTLAVVLCLLVAGVGVAYASTVSREPRARRPRRTATEPAVTRIDPGRDLRAERKARELLRSIVSADDYEMYEALGFLEVAGSAGARGGQPGYGYIVYPHRPIVAYDARTLEPLSEYCVGFPDRSDPLLGERLPDADDVLAKWMSLRAQEHELIGAANMHLPGRQVDPAQVRRDLRRLREWRAVRERTAA